MFEWLNDNRASIAAVIIILHKAHWIMLRRNLLYTAITRAKKFCCIIGSEWAIRTAAEQLEGSERYTGLAHRIFVDS